MSVEHSRKEKKDRERQAPTRFNQRKDDSDDGRKESNTDGDQTSRRDLTASWCSKPFLSGGTKLGGTFQE